MSDIDIETVKMEPYPEEIHTKGEKLKDFVIGFMIGFIITLIIFGVFIWMKN